MMHMAMVWPVLSAVAGDDVLSIVEGMWCLIMIWKCDVELVLYRYQKM